MAEGVKEVTDQTFEAEVLQASLPVVVDMWAPWCGPCRFVAPVLEELAAENEGQVLMRKLNVDENPRTAQQYGIIAIPSVLFFKDGQEKERFIGVRSKGDYQSAIAKLLAEQ